MIHAIVIDYEQSLLFAEVKKINKIIIIIIIIIIILIIKSQLITKRKTTY